jgi:hypothetical protein
MANSSLGGIGGQHDAREIVALDRRVGHGRAIAEGAADAEAEVVREVERVREEVRSQIEPAFEGIARDQLADGDQARGVGVAELDDVQTGLALGGIAERIGVIGRARRRVEGPMLVQPIRPSTRHGRRRKRCRMRIAKSGDGETGLVDQNTFARWPFHAPPPRESEGAAAPERRHLPDRREYPVRGRILPRLDADARLGTTGSRSDAVAGSERLASAA